MGGGNDLIELLDELAVFGRKIGSGGLNTLRLLERSAHHRVVNVRCQQRSVVSEVIDCQSEHEQRDCGNGPGLLGLDQTLGDDFVRQQIRTKLCLVERLNAQAVRHAERQLVFFELRTRRRGAANEVLEVVDQFYWLVEI